MLIDLCLTEGARPDMGKVQLRTFDCFQKSVNLKCFNSEVMVVKIVLLLSLCYMLSSHIFPK